MQSPNVFVPPHDQIKNKVIEWSNNIFEMSIYLDQLIMLKRRDRITSMKYRAAVKAFYEYLKPYITEQTNNNDENITQIINAMEYYRMHPKEFSTSEARACMSVLWEFCKSYGFTIIRPMEVKKT